MKAASIFLSGICIFLMSFSANAQEQKNDYFVGKWAVVIEGTPSGDSNLTLTIARKDGKLQGTIFSDSDESIPTTLEEKEESLTAYFFASGYDLNMYMERQDDNNLTGNLLGMFDVKGSRIEEIKE